LLVEDREIVMSLLFGRLPCGVVPIVSSLLVEFDSFVEPVG
jgi:hypothetical protein